MPIAVASSAGPLSGPRRRICSTSAMDAATCAGSRSEASSASHTPSPWASSWLLSRGVQGQPGLAAAASDPVSVTSRASEIRVPSSSASSGSRGTKLGQLDRQVVPVGAQRTAAAGRCRAGPDRPVAIRARPVPGPPAVVPAEVGQFRAPRAGPRPAPRPTPATAGPTTGPRPRGRARCTGPGPGPDRPSAWLVWTAIPGRRRGRSSAHAEPPGRRRRRVRRAGEHRGLRPSPCEPPGGRTSESARAAFARPSPSRRSGQLDTGVRAGGLRHHTARLSGSRDRGASRRRATRTLAVPAGRRVRLTEIPGRMARSCRFAPGSYEHPYDTLIAEIRQLSEVRIPRRRSLSA